MRIQERNSFRRRELNPVWMLPGCTLAASTIHISSKERKTRQPAGAHGATGTSNPGTGNEVGAAGCGNLTYPCLGRKQRQERTPHREPGVKMRSPPTPQGGLEQAV